MPPACRAVCSQHIQVKHLIKILSVSQLSQPSRILFGECQQQWVVSQGMQRQRQWQQQQRHVLMNQECLDYGLVASLFSVKGVALPPATVTQPSGMLALVHTDKLWFTVYAHYNIVAVSVGCVCLWGWSTGLCTSLEQPTVVCCLVVAVLQALLRVVGMCMSCTSTATPAVMQPLMRRLQSILNCL